MIAFRISDSRRPIFDGTGARLRGGRWNSPGVAVIYAAQTYAGALLEVLVHQNLGRVPRTHAFIRIDVPNDVDFEQVDFEVWRDEAGRNPNWSRKYGDAWLQESRTVVLLVPSAVLQGREHNILINPAHPHFDLLAAIEAQPVEWDARLFLNRSDGSVRSDLV